MGGGVLCGGAERERERVGWVAGVQSKCGGGVESRTNRARGKSPCLVIRRCIAGVKHAFCVLSHRARLVVRVLTRVQPSKL